MFRAKFNRADAVDKNLLNHVIWYSTTGFTRPYPGEKTVLMPSDVKAAGRSVDIEDRCTDSFRFTLAGEKQFGEGVRTFRGADRISLASEAALHG